MCFKNLSSEKIYYDSNTLINCFRLTKFNTFIISTVEIRTKLSKMKFNEMGFNEAKLLIRIYAYEITRVNSRKTNFFTRKVLTL